MKRYWFKLRLWIMDRVMPIGFKREIENALEFRQIMISKLGYQMTHELLKEDSRVLIQEVERSKEILH